MFRLYAIALIFSFSTSVFSQNLTKTIDENSSQNLHLSSSALQNKQISISAMPAIPKHAEIMPVSLSLLLIAIGFALIFLDDHIKKSRNKKE